MPPAKSPLETTFQLVATHAFQTRTIQLSLGTVPWSMHKHSTRLTRVRGWAESEILCYNVHNVRMGVQMAKLAMLQRAQPVGGRSMTGGLINQEVGAPPPSGFPHTMLNVKKVKDNMRLAFIEKLFTNRKIGTNMQTRYLSFKGMSYEHEITCVTSTVFNCEKLWPGFSVATRNLRQY